MAAGVTGVMEARVAAVRGYSGKAAQKAAKQLFTRSGTRK